MVLKKLRLKVSLGFVYWGSLDVAGFDSEPLTDGRGDPSE